MTCASGFAGRVGFDPFDTWIEAEEVHFAAHLAPGTALGTEIID